MTKKLPYLRDGQVIHLSSAEAKKNIFAKKFGGIFEEKWQREKTGHITIKFGKQEAPIKGTKAAI